MLSAMGVFNILLALCTSIESIAGLLEPATDILQPKATYDYLWPASTTK